LRVRFLIFSDDPKTPLKPYCFDQRNSLQVFELRAWENEPLGYFDALHPNVQGGERLISLQTARQTAITEHGNALRL
jgi:hypothetical protein